MQCDTKTLLAEADPSTKLNLIFVGGYADNTVDLCGEGNVDAKRQCLGKGQTMVTKSPSQVVFEECWSEAIIKNGLSPSLVDDLGHVESRDAGVEACTCRAALL